MRVHATISMDVEAANKAITSGEMPRLIGNFVETAKPEGIWFGLDGHGRRSAFCVFDLKNPSDMPSMLEPLFAKVGAQVTLTPVMNGDELQQGLGRIKK